MSQAPPLAEYVAYLAGPPADEGKTAKLKEAWDAREGFTATS
jgi:hypothetical protein